MASLNTKKPLAMAVAIKAEVEQRFAASAIAVTLGQDSDGFPTLLITDANPVNTEANLLVRIRQVQDDTGRVDAVGLAQKIFSPHRAEVLRQGIAATPSAIDSSVRAPVAPTEMQQIVHACVFGMLAKFGLQIDLWNQVAADASSVVANANWASAKKTAEVRSSALNPLIADV